MVLILPLSPEAFFVSEEYSGGWCRLPRRTKVPPIEPDIRGATTLRERLEKHRESKTCAECHHKIDPLGFGLENFDELGRWPHPLSKVRQATFREESTQAKG